MTPQEFVSEWTNSQLTELQGYQTHFRHVCQLVGHVEPGASENTADGEYFHFQRYTRNQSGEGGFADVYFENHFAIEYKGPGKYTNLDGAFAQLQRYQRQLKNPPLLIVTDIENWRIHTNFTNTIPETFEFTNAEIATRPEVRQWLRDIFFKPQVFNPERNTHVVTRESANALKAVADDMRLKYGVQPERAARFLTRIIFSLFAEDIGLLPSIANEKGLFSYLVDANRRNSSTFRADIGNLFAAMEVGGRMHSQDVRWFNGALFKDIETEALSLRAIASLNEACRHNWRYVEPAIFGTLFERCLDPAKRAQLGAHYTSPEDILLIVEPVLMQPLRREWAAIEEQAQPVRDLYTQAATTREKESHKAKLLELRDQMLSSLRTTTVLDAACGSGNFLYIALQEMMALELDIVNSALWIDIDLAGLLVSPEQLYGIEKDEIAHALASIVVWIGYIKWREDHGFRYDEKPLLRDLSDNIVCKDAILGFDDEGNTTSPDWPQVDVIIGNPPFLGDKRMRGELGDDYVDQLRQLYKGRVPGGADLVTYWFELAREQIEKGRAKRAGLLATNSIQIGTNRAVLRRIKESGDIFMAWSDRKWPLDGANVRVSMIGFDNGSGRVRSLDGSTVSRINSDLTSSINIADANALLENRNLVFLGVLKTGPFDISPLDAEKMLDENLQNEEVVKPRLNGRDIVGRPGSSWIIDFVAGTEEYAKQFQAPYDYVRRVVKPVREGNSVKKLRDKWWQHARPRFAMRAAIKPLTRFIATPEVSTHRVFGWIKKGIVPDHTLHVVARDDDYFFGVLHSRLHVLWSLRMGSTLGVVRRYNSSRTFQTFPFPWSPGREDASHPAHARISAAAKQLHEERQAWLHPSSASHSASPQEIGGTEGGSLKDHTLTNLYNALQVYRGESGMRVKPAAGDFAPRLDELHRELDEAACDAYGWDYAILADEEAILRALLALNLQRAAQSG